MENQRLYDKKQVIEAFRLHKVGPELSFLLTNYFKRYLIPDSIVDNLKKNGEIEKKEVYTAYDELSAPLLAGDGTLQPSL